MRTDTNLRTRSPLHRHRHVKGSTCLLIVALLWIVACNVCSVPAHATLQILRPSALQGVGRNAAWMPFGPNRWTGRTYRGTLVWVPHECLCSNIDEAADLDTANADGDGKRQFPSPIAHFGAVSYDEMEGAVALFNASDACPLLNQLFYAEAVLGVVGAVVHVDAPAGAAVKPRFDQTLTAPATHMPAVAVATKDFAMMKAMVVERGVAVEVSLGWSTSEMQYG